MGPGGLYGKYFKIDSGCDDATNPIGGKISQCASLRSAHQTSQPHEQAQYMESFLAFFLL